MAADATAKAYILRQIGSGTGFGSDDLAETLAPSASTAAPAINATRIGLLHVNTSNGAVYISVAVGSASPADDWALCSLTGISPTELAVLDGLLTTTAELNRAADVSTRVVALTGSTSITELLHDGKILLLTGTGSAYTQTLPAATGSGAKFTFVVGAVNTSNHLIKVTGDDVMYGNIVTCSTTETPDLAQPWTTAADSDTITLNGTTTGGQKIGDVIELWDIAADKWLVRGLTTTSSTEATPFSATVS